MNYIIFITVSVGTQGLMNRQADNLLHGVEDSLSDITSRFNNIQIEKIICANPGSTEMKVQVDMPQFVIKNKNLDLEKDLKKLNRSISLINESFKSFKSLHEDAERFPF